MIKFQSTRPVWGETAAGEIWLGAAKVSIHSPRVGRDSKIVQIHSRELHNSARSTIKAWLNTSVFHIIIR